MRGVTLLVLIFLFFLGLFLFFFRWSVQQELPVVGDPPAMPEPGVVQDPPNRSVREVAAGLERVRALEAAPEGGVFVGERSGRIRLLHQDVPDPVEWLALEVADVEGGGLLDLAFQGAGEGGPALYAYLTAVIEEDQDAPPWGRSFEGRVIRIPVEGGEPGTPEPIREGLPAGPRNNGGRLAFGPDGMLYAALGDAGEPRRAQEAADPAGAILRMTPSGEAPSDNPWVESAGAAGLTWALGFRDVRGLAWHPDTGSLFAADRGPSGEWEGIDHLDELNVVERGANHGWPEVVGAPGIEAYQDPLAAWVPGHPPGDLTFARDGWLLMTVVEPAAVLWMRVERGDGRYEITTLEEWSPDQAGDGPFRAPVALAEAPGEGVYLAIGGAEDRGDRVLRLEAVEDE